MQGFERIRIASALLSGAMLLTSSASPIRSQVRGRTTGGGAVVIVHLEEVSGSPFQQPATVTLNSTDDPGGFVVDTQDGIAKFRGVSSRECTVQVTSTGYATVRETVMVMGSSGENDAYIKLQPNSDSQTARRTVAPLLAGKSRRELDLAIAALHADLTAAAKPHIEYALKHAPANPDVHYIAAIYFLSLKDSESAQQHLQSAVGIFPEHFSAQITLGNLLLAQRDATAAIPHLEKALSLDGNSWRGHWLLAEALLQPPVNVAKARFHANRALEFGKQQAADAEITLAIADSYNGDNESAHARLEQFLQSNPQDAGAPRAQIILAKIDAAIPAAAEDSRSLLPIHAMKGSTLLLDVPPGSFLRLPRGVDEGTPLVQKNIVCSLPDALKGAGVRAREFVVALERFSAKEEVTIDALDRAGVTRKSYENSFNYLALLERPRPEIIVVKEMRDGDFAPKGLPPPGLSEGITGIGLVFLPEYAQDFNFSCEGLGQWRGEPAWQVRFEQRDDRPARMHGWQVKDREYPASIKGRAWLSASSYRLLRIETDLAKPIPEIQLDYEHAAIDYAPVKFPSGKGQLWLPVSAEVYARVRKRFYRQEHEFSAFQLFSVKTRDDASDPGQN
jgi:Tfp pilus assembly protein PilF